MVEGPGDEHSGSGAGILSTLRAVAHALDVAGAPFVVGGSFASSVQGVPRSTQDVDLIAELSPERVGDFVRELGERFYADEPRIRDGVARRSSFNVIDLGNGFKADVYLAAGDELGRQQFARRQWIEVDAGFTLPFASPEDVVLQKLRWFALGGLVSERQWLDAVGVVRVQGERLDRAYLGRWAVELGITDLVARALDEGDADALNR